MWGTLVAVLVKLPDWVFKLLDRPVVRMKVNHLKYELLKNGNNDSIVIISLHPSKYRLNLGFSNSGKTTTIEEVNLIIDNQILIDDTFQPLKLEQGDYKVIDLAIPVDKSKAVDQGIYEIKAIYAFNKVCKTEGHFPVIN